MRSGMINSLTYGMPLAALFIGGVLPAQLWSLIRKRAGYMKKNKKKNKATSPQALKRVGPPNIY